MTSEDDTDTHIENQEFDSPLVIPGEVENEPERYIAEKPYDLTKYEFSVLRRKIFSEFWFLTTTGASVGLVLSVAGKTINSLLNSQPTTLESWEIWSIVIGVSLAIIFKFFISSKEDKEKDQLLSAVDGHFSNNKPRKIHLTVGDKK